MYAVVSVKHEAIGAIRIKFRIKSVVTIAEQRQFSYVFTKLGLSTPYATRVSRV
jgi:hypothetical protein